MLIDPTEHTVNHDIDDRIWLLVSNKLANDATQEELTELNCLLKENPEANENVKLMLDWWDAENKESVSPNSFFVFQDILKKIK